MACFSWNPVKSLWVPRTMGLQDKLEGVAWDHLPPDCFGHLYDGLQVDAWSIGVLLVFCLTGTKPFTTPMTLAQAVQQWAAFKEAHPTIFNQTSLSPSASSSSCAPFTEILNRIFVPPEARISPRDLLTELENLQLQKEQQQQQSIPAPPEVPAATLPESPAALDEVTSTEKTDDGFHSFLLEEKVKSNNERKDQ